MCTLDYVKLLPPGMAVKILTTRRLRGMACLVDLTLEREFVRFYEGGQEYVLARDDSLGYHLLHSTEKWAKLAAEVRPEDEYVLDVGANSGIFSAMVAHAVPHCRIACVEPDESLHPVIAHNLRHHDRWEIFNEAVGEEKGRATLYRNPVSTQTSSLDLSAVEATGATRIEEVEVDVVTMDDLVSRLGWPRVDVLKIDIQGLELAALRGGREVLRDVGTLLIEFSLLSADPAGLLTDLQDHFGPGEVVNPVYLGADLLFRRSMADRTTAG
jgi:FkbM family methyltransferase